MTILESATTMRCDDPVQRLGGRTGSVNITIWWLTSPVGPIKFVYGYVVPTHRSITSKWVGPDKVAEESFSYLDATDGREKSGKRRIVRRSIIVEGKTAYSMLDALISGKTLGEASALVNVAAPDVNAEQSLMNPNWIRLPTRFFPTSTSLAGLNPYSRGRASLTDDAGCYCTSFTSPNRFEFLDTESQPDDVLRWTAAVLKEQTGIEFATSGGDAFGSFEIFDFPSLNEQARRRVLVWHRQSEDKSKGTVLLRIDRPSENVDYVAQIRTELLSAISSDQLAWISGTADSIETEIPWPVDGTMVRVWKKEASGNWMLWHEHEEHYIREIHTTLNVMGLTGTVTAPWLEDLSKSRVKSRAQAFTKVAQVSYEMPMVNSTRSSWEKSIQSARDAVRRVNLETSDGRFFGKGWAGENKLDFAIWIKDKLSTHDGSVILVDPYFDVPGLELITRASGAAREIAVLTCTQVRSADDNDSVPRSARLVACAEELLPVLQGLRLRILDVQSKGGGSKQLFHDRYLLFYDTEGSIKKGFNLSTSLQSATRTSPLLVTPIPSDVLDDIADYVATLVHPVPNGPTEIVTLFPTERMRAQPNNFGITSARARTVVQFVEVLQSRTGLVGGDDLHTLNNLGYVTGDGDPKISVPWTNEQLDRIREFLSSTSLTHAAIVWDGAVEVSLREWYHEIPKLLKILCSSTESGIKLFLIRYLLGHAKGELRAQDAEQHVRTLGHVIETSFWDALDNAARFLEYHHEHPVGTSWGIHSALLCLIEYFPRAVDDLVGELVPQGQKAQAILSALAATLTESVRREDTKLLEALAELRNNFARALSAMAKWNQVRHDGSSWLDFNLYLEKYNPVEQQDILARALYDLRVQANRAKSNGQCIEGTTTDMVVQRLLSTFKGEATVERLLELMPGFSGPINGSWARSTHDAILEPLIESKKLPCCAPFQIWQTVLAAKKPGEFYAGTDFELIQVWGAAFRTAEAEQRIDVSNEAQKRLRYAVNVLYEPFVASRNYDRWRKAADTILVWMLRLWAILRQGPSDEMVATLQPIASQVATIVDSEELVQSAIGELQHASRQVLDEFRTLAADDAGVSRGD